ncbi:hypothetical protein Q7P37_005008 [Cladosporium fusiforme]
MSTSTPATPCVEEPPTTPRRIAMSRSFTVPPKLTVSTRAAPTPEIGAAEGIETLYVHPRASIIKFTTGGSRPSSSSGSPRARVGENTGGTLPWAYPTESTVAAGPMEIYRVPGSVSFLHSGALLHAILPRSQCWCVDGVSKFAFRVLPETYYRIELPGETEEDMELVEALKVTLKKVLFYERTPCPFARGFTVELPKEEVRVQKRRSVREGPAKKWRLQKAYSWKPEGWEEEEMKRKLDAGEAPSSGEEGFGYSDEEREALTKGNVEQSTAAPLNPRSEASRGMRSVTVPSQLQMSSIPPSRVRSRVQAVESVDQAERAEKVRFSAEVDRRSSIRRQSRLSTSIPIDLPPSPPDSNTGIEGRIPDDVSEDGSDLEDDNGTTVVDVAGASGVKGSANEDLALSDLDDDQPKPKDDGTVEGAEALDAPEQDMPSTDPRNEREYFPTQSTESVDEIVQYDESSLPRQLAATTLLDEYPDEDVVNSEDDVVEPAAAKLTSISEHAAMKQPSPARSNQPEDPYAAIQARIQARRSIGGATTSFQPSSKPPSRKSTASTSSTATLASHQRPIKPTVAQRNHSITAALVNKACAVFLGPPAHLVTMMLRIAARFSSGAFGSSSMFFVESPVGSPRRVPGSFYLEDEDPSWKSEEDEEDWEEDDFGVPLKSPVRISGVRERARREGWELE